MLCTAVWLRQQGVNFTCLSFDLVHSWSCHLHKREMAQVFAGKRQRVIGILREVKNKWERRVPLIPSDVSSLTKQGVRVLVQPSTMRIYKDAEFRQAGAELVEDISSANTIFGVKEFPKEQLIKNKSYMIFSHTIKAQEYNMPFLDACLERNVRLFDYETIRAVAPPSKDGAAAQAGGRLVAFGKFAGFAGMIDAFRGVGERLLSLGYSSPFMGISSSYMYPDLPTAKAAIRKAGEEIAQYGLPPEIAPMRFIFTGTGNVARGAQEIFELLPHKYVKPSELATLPHDPHVVYGCVVTAEDMVEPLDPSKKFDKKEYYASPHLYRPIFHEKIAPHMNVLVNCMYWDTRFPRLITLQQMRALEETYADNKQRKFLALADITCDIQGSVEFLKRSCTIDNPFFMYNPVTDDVSTKIEGRGVLVLGIDNLPAEFPKDASQHFSSALKQFVVPLSESDTSKPFSEATSYLPMEIYNSCITADGKLTPPYEYIAKMRAASAAAAASTSAKTGGVSTGTSSSASASLSPDALSIDLMLEGHLFDTGFINQALDIFESEGMDFEVVQWVISPNRSERAQNVSRAVIHVTLENQSKLEKLFQRVNTLASRMPSAHAKMVRLTYDSNKGTYSGEGQISFQASKRPAAAAVAPAVSEETAGPSSGTSPSSSGSLNSAIHRSTKPKTTLPKRRVLVLGSGFVAGPLVEYLLRRPENSITVASAVRPEAERLVKPFLTTNESSRVQVHELNVNDTSRLRELIQEHDLIVSLLPAAFHTEVAKISIEYHKNMVTASYVSPSMKALHEQAKKSGITILNEMGLDPGLDHLACMEIIDDAHKRGSKIVSFKSLCGGLPAPEACNNNPFAYKFSWSPLGMLLATQNTAIYREGGKEVEIPNTKLLTSAKSLDLNPAYRLEYYANRDSLSYENVYGIGKEVKNMFRGTIRYADTARLLHGYAKLGLLDRATSVVLPKEKNWNAYLCHLLNTTPKDLKSTVMKKLLATGDFDDAGALRVAQSMEWLGLFSTKEALLRGASSMTASSDSTRTYNSMELLCSILQEKLQYAPGERDMVIMYHEFEIEHKDGSKSMKRSRLISYGGDDAVTNTNPLIVNTPGGGGRKGYSAMSRTVGIPAAIGAQMILDGKIGGRGVIIPTTSDIYKPVLQEMKEKEGIEFIEDEIKLD